MRGHTTTDPYARTDTAVSAVLTLTPTSGRWLIC